MRVIFIIFLSIFLLGCSNNRINSSKSAIILFKTPKIKYYDTGFVNRSKDKLSIKILSTGVTVLSIDIDTHTCLNSICYEKDSFNQNYLSSYYYDDILEDIFLSRPIFKKSNLKKVENGFEQYIKNSRFDIKYIVTKDNIYFKDYINKITIKITNII